MQFDSAANPWISEIYNRWVEIDVQNFLENIGINCTVNFFETLAACNLNQSPFKNSIWEILPHSAITAGVLHCYPIKVESSRVLWEEWFSLDGEIHHHVLSNLPFKSENGVWTPDENDLDHPAEVLGRSWHYENTSDLRPALLKSKGF